MEYALDTNHASALFREDATLRSRMSLAGEVGARFCFPMPVVAELYFMVWNSTRVEHNLVRLDRAIVGARLLQVDHEAAVVFGRIRAELRRRGEPIPVMDMLIAAVAYVNDLTLLTADEHFQRVDGLRVENWL